ncbi:hypothetical protein K8B83_08545 [Shewanella inventionis]|uniref:hypothetical protein n=1 Tax=Shewanella inventionis TaxID=1738770 RepID=UPI001CBD87BF|nr:hypothetical protein [Shewanella inventionis]UAL44839.1 hypothetical protein K8B83_08545 [Shewanella inventionis]
MAQQQDDAAFTALQTEIKQTYHQQTLEQPSAELDEAILAKAKSARHAVAKNNKGEPAMWRRNAWLFSTAASVVLVAGLFILSPSLQQQAGINLEKGLPKQQMDVQSLDSETVMPLSTSDMSADVAEAQLNETQGMSISADSLKPEQAMAAPASVEVLTDSSFSDKIPIQNRSQQALAESQQQAQATKKVADAEAAQRKAAALPIRQQEKELKLMKQQLENPSKGTIELDTAEAAFARLQALMADNKIKQAEGYMITMEQRFPELLSPAHPLYEQYQKIKVQLTSQ